MDELVDMKKLAEINTFQYDSKDIAIMVFNFWEQLQLSYWDRGDIKSSPMLREEANQLTQSWIQAGMPGVFVRLDIDG